MASLQGTPPRDLPTPPVAGRDPSAVVGHPTSTWVQGGLAAFCVTAALVAGYLGNFRDLVAQWNRDPNYSYGYFVIPIAAIIVYSRRGMIDPAKVRPRWWAFLPLLAMIGVRYWTFERNEQYIETATIPLTAIALVFALGGWHLIKAAWPALLFLFFMLPLPPTINGLLAGPILQSWATIGSVTVLQLMNLPVMSEGNVILIGETPLEVARACNGLSMLLSFVTLVTATVFLIRRPFLEQSLLLVSAIPIAVFSNVLRITVTALCYHWIGQEVAEKYAHDWAGYAMMIVALMIVWVELKVCSWLIVEVEEYPATALRQDRGRGPVVS